MLTEYFHNSHKDTKHYPNELCSVLNLDNTAVAFEEIKTWNGYSETPLHSLDVIAENIGVKSIYYKDESSRFGLGSFKALGGTYGVLKFIHHALQKEINTEISIQDIHQGKYSKQISKYTVTTATDGNHGRTAVIMGERRWSWEIVWCLLGAAWEQSKTYPHNFIMRPDFNGGS